MFRFGWVGYGNLAIQIRNKNVHPENNYFPDLTKNFMMEME